MNDQDRRVSPRTDKNPHALDIWVGGNSERLTPYQKKRARTLIRQRDGILCGICKQTAENNELIKSIHHINGESSQHWLSNLCLSHVRCNSRESNKKRLGLHPITDTSQEERTRRSPLPMSEEVRLNKLFEPFWRRQAYELVKDYKTRSRALSRASMVDQLRELVGCSESAGYSYNKKLFAGDEHARIKGPLVEDEDMTDGSWFVKFRDINDEDLSIEDLEAKYPKEGRRYAIPIDKK